MMHRNGYDLDWFYLLCNAEGLPPALKELCTHAKGRSALERELIRDAAIPIVVRFTATRQRRMAARLVDAALSDGGKDKK